MQPTVVSADGHGYHGTCAWDTTVLPDDFRVKVRAIIHDGTVASDPDDSDGWFGTNNRPMSIRIPGPTRSPWSRPPVASPSSRER